MPDNAFFFRSTHIVKGIGWNGGAYLIAIFRTFHILQIILKIVRGVIQQEA